MAATGQGHTALNRKSGSGLRPVIGLRSAFDANSRGRRFSERPCIARRKASFQTAKGDLSQDQKPSFTTHWVSILYDNNQKQ